LSPTKELWAKLTDGDLHSVKGKVERLAGVLQEEDEYSSDSIGWFAVK